MEGVPALLGYQLQASGISEARAREQRVLWDRPDGSRESFLGKQSPWEGGQEWSWGQGMRQALGRASTSQHAPLQGISSSLHRAVADTVGATGSPTSNRAVVLCDPTSCVQGGWRCWWGGTWPRGNHSHPQSKPSLTSIISSPHCP